MFDTDYESEKIYLAIFNKKIPSLIQDRFRNISAKIDGSYSEEEVSKYRECIFKIHDLEAIEVAARFSKKLPILTDKFKVMVYLAETLPENYSIFISEEQKRLSGYMQLVSSLTRTMYKIAKGLFLLTGCKL
jgi:hypothetical protein